MGEVTHLPGAYETPMRTMASAENKLRESKILGQKIYFEWKPSSTCIFKQEQF